MHQEEVEIHRMDAMGHQKTKQSLKQIHETNSTEFNKELQEIRQKLKNTERQHNLLMIEKEKEWNEKQTGKYFKRRERASRNGSTVVDISMTPPSFKPVS